MIIEIIEGDPRVVGASVMVTITREYVMPIITKIMVIEGDPRVIVIVGTGLGTDPAPLHWPLSFIIVIVTIKYVRPVRAVRRDGVQSPLGVGQHGNVVRLGCHQNIQIILLVARPHKTLPVAPRHKIIVPQLDFRIQIFPSRSQKLHLRPLRKKC